jgi:predicted kinase
MSGSTFVVVSGLPASGKTTLAAQLGHTLDLEHLDKDVFLNELLGREEATTVARRRQLSRLADAMLREHAAARPFAILSSWWRHPNSRANSGTDVSWLSNDATQLVEVYCECPPFVAVERFVSRQRHPGHLDALRTREDLLAQFTEAERLGPLFPAVALRCNTEFPVPASTFDDLAESLRQRIGHPNSSRV